MADFLAVNRTIHADPDLAMTTWSLIDLRMRPCATSRGLTCTAVKLPTLPRQAETRMAVVAPSPLA